MDQLVTFFHAIQAGMMHGYSHTIVTFAAYQICLANVVCTHISADGDINNDWLRNHSMRISSVHHSIDPIKVRCCFLSLRCHFFHLCYLTNDTIPSVRMHSLIYRIFFLIFRMHMEIAVVMEIAPGEPVPPGFENEVKAVAEIQSKIDKCKSTPFIGLEYLLELRLSDDKEPGYLCVLCEKRGDPRTIMDHITSYKHRLKYLVNRFFVFFFLFFSRHHKFRLVS